MSEHGLDPDSFLTELDGRLRAIQAELRPGAAVPTLSVRATDAEPPAEPRRGRTGPLSALLGRARPEPDAGEPSPDQSAPDQGAPDQSASSESAELLAHVKAMTETQTRLLAASERLLEAFARMLESPSEPASPPGLFTPTTPPPQRAGVEIAAGPFADTESLREFERALERLDAVRRVTVRGFEGSDRAILDVELAL
jgi:hypothetical protein